MTATAGVRGLRLGDRLLAELVGHLRAAMPQEAVGLLGGTDEDGWVRATRFYPGTNLDASRTRYTMDPEEVLAGLRDMEARGERLAAIAHSHPETPAVPSATDLEEFHYWEALLVIVSLATSQPEPRCWRIDFDDAPVDRGVVEVPLIVEKDEASSPGVVP
jgi:[CysO sulfur-carrier protein]-S-L-cysteine hydrolase